MVTTGNSTASFEDIPPVIKMLLTQDYLRMATWDHQNNRLSESIFHLTKTCFASLDHSPNSKEAKVHVLQEIQNPRA